MIHAIAYPGFLEVELRHYSEEERERDQAEWSQIPTSEKRFNPDKGIWTVRHPQRYRDLPFVRRALETRQPLLVRVPMDEKRVDEAIARLFGNFKVLSVSQLDRVWEDLGQPEQAWPLRIWLRLWELPRAVAVHLVARFDHQLVYCEKCACQSSRPDLSQIHPLYHALFYTPASGPFICSACRPPNPISS
jgi:hypothetical protein